MNNPSSSNIEQKLNALYSLEPADEFVNRLEKDLQKQRVVRLSPWQSWVTNLQQGRGRSRLALACIAILLLAALLFATPQGRALAQEILHFFTTTDATSYPLDPTEKAGLQGGRHPTPVPTSVPPLETLNPSVYDVPSAYLTRLEQAAATLGFAPKTLPFTQPPADFIIQDVAFDKTTGILMITYTNPFGMMAFLEQGAGDFPAVEEPWDLVPVDSVQKVTVNGTQGEYVEGGFGIAVVDGVYSDKATWDTTATNIARLRWREGDRWFELMRVNSPELSAPIERDDFIALAEALVTFGLDKAAPAGLDVVLQRVDFAPRMPQNIPAGFIFLYAQYDAASQSLLLVYTSGDDILAVVEKPSSMNGDTSANYTTYPFNGPNTAQQVIWDADGVALQLHYFQAGAHSDTGVRLQKTDLLAIAESMK